MKIFTMVEIDIETGDVSRETSYDWDGPVALAMGDGGLTGDLGSGAAVAVAGEGGEPAAEPEAPGEGIVPGEDGGEGGEGGEGAAEPTGETTEQEPVVTEPEKEILPAQLSKALRELKQ